MSTVVQAALALAAGELVAFPTETVYGLGADATNEAAVAKIFAMKGRPENHPLIVHFSNPGAIDHWASIVPAHAKLLAERFWPGPLTMILARTRRVPLAVTSGQDTVGLRCPSHPVAQALLEEFARVGSGAVAAPSANRFGHVSPTTAQHVRDEFGEGLMVLDGGACEVGLESTIIDLTRGRPVLLRPGGISREALAKVLGEMPADRDEHAPRASGTLASHYAPRTAVAVVGAAEVDAQTSRPANVAVLAMRPAPPAAHAIDWIDAGTDARRYGHDLYANLRALDALGAKLILVESPPLEPAWEAINDRLERAASGDQAL